MVVEDQTKKIISESSMSSSSSSRAAALKRKNVKIAEKFRAVCPPHKVKDLEQLVKVLKGDEDSIRAQIQEWWDEPEKPVEPEWEQINKRKPKKILPTAGAGSGSVAAANGGAPASKGGGGGKLSERGSSGPRDSGRGRGMSSRKGVQSGRGLGGRGGGQRTQEEIPEQLAPDKDAETADVKAQEEESSPMSVAGAAGFVSAQDPTPSGEIALLAPTKLPGGAPSIPSNVWATKGSAHIIDAEKPKPAATVTQTKQSKAITRKAASGKPRRPPTEVEEIDSSSALGSKSLFLPEENTPILPEVPSSSWVQALETNTSGNIDLASALMASVTDAVTSPLKPAQPMLEQDQVVNDTATLPVPVHKLQPAINMGRWDVSEGEQAHGLDFGFDSFGHEDTEELTSVATPLVTPLSHVVTEGAGTTSIPEPPIPLSPARPPPGLGISTSGMPPMPPNAVLVHELEGKLERSSLEAAAKVEEEKQVPSEVKQADVPPPPAPQSVNPSKAPEKSAPTATRTQQLPLQQEVAPDMSALGVTSGMPSIQGIPQHSAMSQNYPSYAPAMAGMYNYGANLGGAFVGIPTLGVIPPQQQKLPQQGSQQPLPSQGLYASSTSSGPVPASEQTKQEEGNEVPASSTAGATSSSLNAMGGPPGMHAGMPYNPAIAFYGQQHYAPQMGQPHGGVGYGAYGYGAAHQFGGAPSGYGYQQLAMGQSGGYGQPYDHQAAETQHLSIAQQTAHHSASSAYQKNPSGYRGRSTHHTQATPSHQYQNQYTPQHGLGYGAAQPYGAMGYSSMDHFQRAGYGPAAGAMNNPYGMQQASAYGQGIGPSSGVSGFVAAQDDPNDRTHGSKGKGGKGGGIPRNPGSFGSNTSNMPQFQQVGAQGQPFGLQPVDPGSSANTSGWGNQSWGGHAWQQGGGS